MAVRSSQAMLALAAALVALGLALAGPAGLRLRRRVARLHQALGAARAELGGLVTELRAERAQAQSLWRPAARAWRWLRHPLTRALLASYRRRRRRGRARAGSGGFHR